MATASLTLCLYVTVVVFLKMAAAAVPAQTPITVGQRCISGTHHPSYSFSGNSTFTGACAHYRQNSCCTTDTALAIERSGDQELYSFYWDGCGTVSDECERYLKLESCFYECDPYIQRWQHPTLSYAVQGVPVCAGFCNKWYDACKNVQICTDDFVNGFNLTNGRYYCPTNHTCRTFEQWYGSAEALCNRQWGTSFVYSNQPNCFTMEFTGANPNACARSMQPGEVANASNCAAQQGSGTDAVTMAPSARLLVELLAAASALSMLLM